MNLRSKWTTETEPDPDNAYRIKTCIAYKKLVPLVQNHFYETLRHEGFVGMVSKAADGGIPHLETIQKFADEQLGRVVEDKLYQSEAKRKMYEESNHLPPGATFTKVPNEKHGEDTRVTFDAKYLQVCHARVDVHLCVLAERVLHRPSAHSPYPSLLEFLVPLRTSPWASMPWGT